MKMKNELCFKGFCMNICELLFLYSHAIMIARDVFPYVPFRGLRITDWEINISLRTFFLRHVAENSIC